MARNTWSVEIYSGGIWVADGTVYRPNTQFQIGLSATTSKIRLANGSNAFETPETKSIPEAITFEWLELDYTDSLITKLQAYINSGNYVRITNHKSETFTGRFMSLQRVWLTEAVADRMDIQVLFDRIL